MSEQSQAVVATQQVAPMLALIDRAARDPNVDISKMEQLLALSERIHDRQAKAEYDNAMNAAQGEMRSISRDCHNPQTRSRYASYEAIDNAIRPVYTAHGFAMSFGSKASTQPDRVIATCRISHRAGHAECVELEMPADGKGPQGNSVMTRTHATGSALSYAKRYIANMVWNLSFGEADDDGNAAGRRQESRPAEASTNQPTTPPRQPVSKERLRERMFENLKQFNAPDVQAFMAHKGWGQEWPLDEVPVDRPGLDRLIRDMEEFIVAKNGLAPAQNEFTEPFWNAVITVPRARMKRADYMERPDTIKGLYEAMKGGDNDARTRLFGLAREWEPQEWTGNDGKLQPPGEADVTCRKNLDLFLEYMDARKEKL